MKTLLLAAIAALGITLTPANAETALHAGNGLEWHKVSALTVGYLVEINTPYAPMVIHTAGVVLQEGHPVLDGGEVIMSGIHAGNSIVTLANNMMMIVPTRDIDKTPQDCTATRDGLHLDIVCTYEPDTTWTQPLPPPAHAALPTPADELAVRCRLHLLPTPSQADCHSVGAG